MGSGKWEVEVGRGKASCGGDSELRVEEWRRFFGGREVVMVMAIARSGGFFFSCFGIVVLWKSSGLFSS